MKGGFLVLREGKEGKGRQLFLCWARVEGWLCRIKEANSTGHKVI